MDTFDVVSVSLSLGPFLFSFRLAFIPRFLYFNCLCRLQCKIDDNLIFSLLTLLLSLMKVGRVGKTMIGKLQKLFGRLKLWKVSSTLEGILSEFIERVDVHWSAPSQFNFQIDCYCDCHPSTEPDSSLSTCASILFMNKFNLLEN